MNQSRPVAIAVARGQTELLAYLIKHGDEHGGGGGEQAGSEVARRRHAARLGIDAKDYVGRAAIDKVYDFCTQSPPRGVGTLVENSGWAARFVLAEALGLVLAQLGDHVVTD